MGGDVGQGSDSDSAEAVAVACGGGPMTRAESPEHAVAPAALVEPSWPLWRLGSAGLGKETLR